MGLTLKSIRTIAIVTAVALAATVALMQPWAASGGIKHSGGDGTVASERSGHGKNLTQRNKQIVRRFNELGFRDGNDAAALALVGEEYTNYEAGGVTTNRAALEGLLAAFPGDPNFALDEVIGEKDLVTVRYEAVLNGAPTIGIDIYRVRGGKIVEHWDSFAFPTNQPTN